jgi:hypothetical protein
MSAVGTALFLGVAAPACAAESELFFLECAGTASLPGDPHTTPRTEVFGFDAKHQTAYSWEKGVLEDFCAPARENSGDKCVVKISDTAIRLQWVSQLSVLGEEISRSDGRWRMWVVFPGVTTETTTGMCKPISDPRTAR